MSQASVNHMIELAPPSEEMAARQAQTRGQSVEEYLGALVADALARRDVEEPPQAGPDALSFWEQAMDNHWSEPAH